ncbi:6-phosphofructokinase [Treponema brennaborense]|uniref:ATP-dependent 6-phosphofructokinase n=1 Tax=Treponema brennaborense (strain DSM 12168 / CIP 105900 / DD5/3) TaxID=906968 RepID=F4LNG7_TREBD|nr:ATP-dependent 6-phosphofructokinase [Treponema brennaborense]AEE17925.1 6-phosphofructokinase [Treponema brennaborense DSM 12168]
MQKSAVKTFGILTSGGDAPGLNAAIRGVARTAIDQFGMNVIGIEHGYRGLIEGNARELHPEDFSGILTRGGTILGTSREKPFKNEEIDPETGMSAVERIKANYKKWGLDALVVLGGNGTNTTGSLLAQEGLNVIGLPKTIDNDLVETDITFGFHTAVSVATEAIDRIHTTAHSHNRIMVIEVMGHKAGWLGLYAGVAGGGDVILLPEIPYNIASIADHLKKRRDAGKAFSIVVVAEGALSEEEALMDKKTFKKSRLAMPYSIAYRVAHELEEATALESRVTVLGYLQRGGTPVAYDRALATIFGTAAAHMLSQGDFGKMVALQNGKVVGVPLENVAGKIKRVPLDDKMLLAGREVGTCFGD